MPNKITLFKDDNGFLSNFYPCKINLDGIDYPSVEHAFQAAKADIADAFTFVGPDGKRVTMPTREYIKYLVSPAAAKRVGRKTPLRPGWNEMRVSVMEDLVRQKFTNNANLSTHLLATGDAELIEGNWWGDTFWGVCHGKGENHLGEILMRVRGELRAQQPERSG